MRYWQSTTICYIALTKEYYLAQCGFTDLRMVMTKLTKSIDFFLRPDEVII